jgi:hypothetical protein
MNLEYFHFDISFDFVPFNFKVLDIDLAIPNGEPWQFCTGISAKTKAVTMEINTNWGWPNCSWGFFEHYFGWRVRPSWGGENGCPMKYWGRDFGNDTPLWSHTFWPILNN